VASVDDRDSPFAEQQAKELRPELRPLLLADPGSGHIFRSPGVISAKRESAPVMGGPEMARIQGVPQNKASVMVKLTYRLGPRMMKKLAGRLPQRGSGIEPMEIWAYQPKMMMAMGKYNQAIRKGRGVDERLRNLIELKGAQMIGCEFCVDLGSQICRNSGLSDNELLALPNYRCSDLFTDREKAALDYAVGVMRTPVDVTDELFSRMREQFTAEQLVEITALLTLVNLDRFNAAFGIGAAGFSDGMVCVLPDRPAAPEADSRADAVTEPGAPAPAASVPSIANR
jgi:AhpD family alkylhydroperoxidase